jgi:sec-independent protein translocase protein TatA
MGIPAPTELLLILGIVLLIFGGKRIPEIMGGLGQGIKSLKKNLEAEDAPAERPAVRSNEPPSQLAKSADATGVRAEAK